MRINTISVIRTCVYYVDKKRKKKANRVPNVFRSQERALYQHEGSLNSLPGCRPHILELLFPLLEEKKNEILQTTSVHGKEERKKIAHSLISTLV